MKHEHQIAIKRWIPIIEEYSSVGSDLAMIHFSRLGI